jgi:hypothetical protein
MRKKNNAALIVAALMSCSVCSAAETHRDAWTLFRPDNARGFIIGGDVGLSGGHVNGTGLEEDTGAGTTQTRLALTYRMNRTFDLVLSANVLGKGAQQTEPDFGENHGALYEFRSRGFGGAIKTRKEFFDGFTIFGTLGANVQRNKRRIFEADQYQGRQPGCGYDWYLGCSSSVKGAQDVIVREARGRALATEFGIGMEIPRNWGQKSGLVVDVSLTLHHVSDLGVKVDYLAMVFGLHFGPL